MADKIIADSGNEIEDLFVSLTYDGHVRIIQGDDYILCTREQFDKMVEYFNE